MSTTTTDRGTAVRARAEEIVSSGTDVRPRLAEVVAQNAGESRRVGGLVALVRAVTDGAREGLARSVPGDPDHVLRQVVDALGDGLSRAALAGQLALREADASARQFATEDLADLRDDLTAARDLFAETVERGLSAGKAFTAGQVAAARGHAERVAERVGPAVAQALDAARRHPVAFAREGVRAGVGAGQGAAGALFQAMGRLLQRAGDQLRPGGGPNGAAPGG